MKNPLRFVSLPALLGMLLLIALCVSGTWWALRLFQPAPRTFTAPPPPAAKIDHAAIAQLFGHVSAVAGNYRLRGIVLAQPENDSLAVVSTDGKPAETARIGADLAPGTRLLEIHADHILLSENGVQKRVALPQPARTAASPRK